jgi:hypothetical protein
LSSPIDSARARRAVSPQAAREQAAEYHGFAASVDIQIGDEVFEIPNPSLLDDDQQERFNDLNAEIERTCDREDDIEIPEHTTEDGTVFPARTLKGDIKRPYTIDGEPIKPAYNTRVAMALFGDERYARFKAGGGRSNQIALIWGQMNREFEARQESDSKSAGSVQDSSPVSD